MTRFKNIVILACLGGFFGLPGEATTAAVGLGAGVTGKTIFGFPEAETAVGDGAGVTGVADTIAGLLDDDDEPEEEDEEESEDADLARRFALSDARRPAERCSAACPPAPSFV